MAPTEPGRTASACPACGSPALERWRRATASDPELAGGAEFELARCRSCGSAKTLGGPPPAEVYEAGTYAPPRRGLSALLEPLRRLADRDRTRFVSDLEAGSRVLEVGAGDGRLVARMRELGLDARGIDPSPSACEAARAIGVPVECVSADEAQVAPGSFDAVVIWHALEHLERPAEALERTRSWLCDGGRLIVAVPNIGGLQARIGGDRWFHQDVPRHRTHFTPAGLERLLARTGFEALRGSQLLVEQNPLGMWQTLLNRLTDERDFAFRLLKRDLPPADSGARARDLAITFAAGALLVPLAVGLELAAGLHGQGGSMVVEAEAR